MLANPGGYVTHVNAMIVLMLSPEGSSVPLLVY